MARACLEYSYGWFLREKRKNRKITSANLRNLSIICPFLGQKGCFFKLRASRINPATLNNFRATTGGSHAVFRHDKPMDSAPTATATTATATTTTTTATTTHRNATGTTRTTRTPRRRETRRRGTHPLLLHSLHHVVRSCCCPAIFSGHLHLPDISIRLRGTDSRQFSGYIK